MRLPSGKTGESVIINRDVFPTRGGRRGNTHMASERATRARARSIKMGASASKPATTATGGPTSGKHKEAKLALAVGGIFFAFSAFAVLQEDVYATKHGPKGEKFTHTFFVLLVERAVNTVVGALGCAAFGRTGIDVPIREILVSGVSQMLAMATGNEALRYVSFTTQVLGKSCKMVPVMIGGVAAGRKYPTSQYLQVLVVTLGVIVFNLGKSKPKSAADDSAFGLGLIALALARRRGDRSRHRRDPFPEVESSSSAVPLHAVPSMELEQDGERDVGVVGGVAHLRDAELGGGPVAAAHGRRLVHPVAEHLGRELLERRPVAAGGRGARDALGLLFSGLLGPGDCSRDHPPQLLEAHDFVSLVLVLLGHPHIWCRRNSLVLA